MKTNGTRIMWITLLLYFFLVLLSFSSFAQPDYDFSNGSLISGTNNQIGARYRFTTVKPGIDAIVTVTNMTGGVTLNNIDGSSGFAEALQPVIDVPAGGSGYVELKIDFVLAAGTTPAIMLEVPSTCIDVDGKKSGSTGVYEFDMITLGLSSYVDYNQLGGELNIAFLPGWAVGQNIAGIDYPGVDTMAKQAMFSVVNANISTITARVGASNSTSSTAQRLRSIYFKKFTYANSFLALPALLSFRGTSREKSVELNWDFRPGAQVNRIVVERAEVAGQFSEIGEVWTGEGSGADQGYGFNDANGLAGGVTYYRLKMFSADKSIQYSSILIFRSRESVQSSPFKVYPSLVTDRTTLSLEARSQGTALLQLVDYAGRIVRQQNLQVKEGLNTVQVEGLDRLGAGTYVAVLRFDQHSYQQRICRQ